MKNGIEENNNNKDEKWFEKEKQENAQEFEKILVQGIIYAIGAGFTLLIPENFASTIVHGVTAVLSCASATHFVLAYRIKKELGDLIREGMQKKDEGEEENKVNPETQEPVVQHVNIKYPLTKENPSSNIRYKDIMK